jgi:hypothetical protein
MRKLLSRILLVCLLTVLTAGSVAGGAAAQAGNPFTPLPQAAPDTTTVDTTTTSSTGAVTDDGLERWQEILIFLAGVALLAGIAFAIIGDARRAAPVTEDDAAGAHQSSAAGARKGQSKAKARKKAKAARAARKQNR